MMLGSCILVIARLNLPDFQRGFALGTFLLGAPSLQCGLRSTYVDSTVVVDFAVTSMGCKPHMN